MSIKLEHELIDAWRNFLFDVEQIFKKIYDKAYSIKTLPYILRNHRDLAPKNVFEDCSNSLPTRWK